MPLARTAGLSRKSQLRHSQIKTDRFQGQSAASNRNKGPPKLAHWGPRSTGVAWYQYSVSCVPMKVLKR